MPEGVKAWSVFGTVGLEGLGKSIGQLQAFNAAGAKAASGVGGVSAKTALLAGGLAAASVAALALGSASVRAFAEFDQAMTRSLAIMGDVDDAMRDRLAGRARQVARDTTFSATQAAESIFFLASAGLDAAASLKSMGTVSRFAQAGAFDMALATDLLTDAQSALGLTIRDDAVANMLNMIRVSDALVKANTLANATVQQFSESLTTRAGAALRLVNKDIEEGLAVLSVFADQGIKGAEAGTRMSIAMREMQQRAIENKEAFHDAGVEVFDASGKMRNMADIVEDLEGHLAGMSDEQQRASILTLGFSARSVSAILALLGFSDAIRRYEADLRDAGGTTDDVANKQIQNLIDQVGLLGSEFKDVGIAAGEQLAKPVEIAVRRMRDVMRNFRAELRAVGELGPRAFLMVGGGAARVGRLLIDAEESLDGFAESAVRSATRAGRALDQLRAEGADDAIIRQGEAILEVIRLHAGRVGAEVSRANQAARDGSQELFEHRRDLARQTLQNEIALANELDRLVEASVEQRKVMSLDMLRLQAEIGEVSKQQLLARLQEELRGEEEGTDRFIALRREVFQVEQQIARERRLLEIQGQQGRELAARQEQQLAQEREAREQRLIQLALRTGEITLAERLRTIDVMLLTERMSADQQIALMEERVRLAERMTGDQVNAAQGVAQANVDAAVATLEAWRLTVETLGVAFPALLKKIDDAIADIRDRVEGQAQDMEAQLAGAGRSAAESFVRGFLRGTLAQGDFVKRIMMMFFERFVLAAMFQSMGMFSESKVAFGAGKNFAGSFAHGILSGAPDVQRAMMQLGQPAMAGIAVGGMATAGGPLTAMPATSGPSLAERALASIGEALDRLPPPRNVFESARDADFQELLREAILVAENEGFRRR